MPSLHRAPPTRPPRARAPRGRRRRRAPARVGWIASWWLAAALVLPGCRSSEEWKEATDDEVYELVEERLQTLDPDTTEFTIEPPEDSLRQRLLAGAVPEALPLDLEELLVIAAENSREYQQRKERVYRLALAVTLERWRLSWIPVVGASGTLEGTGSDTQSIAVRPSAQLAKVLSSGAEVLLGIGLTLTKSLTPGNDGWSSSLDLLDFRQPLLRGFGERIVREPLTQAERDLVYEVRAYERFRRSFAVETAERLYRILQQYDTVANEERNRDNLVRLRERNEALSEAGRLSEIEVDQARQDELRARERVISAQTQLGTLLDELSLFLGLPVEIELDLDRAELAELAEQGLPQIDVDQQQAVGIALAYRLDNMTALDLVTDSERKVEVAADALRIGLDITGSLGYSSEPGKPLKFDLDEPEWSIGAVLDLPTDRLPERNVYRAALIDRELAQRSAEEVADTIVADVRLDLRALDEAREDYAIQQNAVLLANRRIESTVLNLQAGRATTRDLLEAQQALVEAENATTQALVDYTLARLFLFNDLELVRFDERGLTVAEPPLAPATGEADPGLEPEGEGGPSEDPLRAPGWRP